VSVDATTVVDLTIPIGAPYGFSLFYKEALPDGTPTDPIDLTGSTAEIEWSGGKISYATYGGASAAISDPTGGQIDVSLSESAIANLVHFGMRRYRVRTFVSGVAIAVLVQGEVTFR
jgi:hypothetical protein